MTRGFIFWLMMFLWFLALIGAYFFYPAYGWLGSAVFLFILLGLLGWQVFGSPVKG